MESEIILEFQNVSLAYSRQRLFRTKTSFTALEDVSFSVRRGEVLGLIGKNGAGKSSLLKLLAGIIDPDSGKVINRGVNVALLAPQVGFDHDLTGRDNAIWSLMLQGRSKEEAQSYLPEIIKFAELGIFFDKPIKQYSMGMRTRLGFAVAHCVGTDVILIDEALGVGDRLFRKKSQRAIEERMEGSGTFVLASHNMKLISELCERVIWIENGKVREFGDAKTILTEYIK